MYSERAVGNGVALWRSSGSAGGPIPADGAVDLILRDEKLHVAGPSTRWINTAADSVGDTIGVRLAPGTAASFLGGGLSEVRDRVIPAADLVGVPRATQLRARISAAAVRDPRDEAAACEFLAESRGEVLAWTRVARAAARRGVSVREVAARLGWSERSLRRHMDAAFGYGYPTLIRIERAAVAVARIARGAELAELAAVLGYADQAHLTRELGRFAGATPTQLVQQAER